MESSVLVSFWGEDKECSPVSCSFTVGRSKIGVLFSFGKEDKECSPVQFRQGGQRVQSCSVSVGRTNSDHTFQSGRISSGDTLIPWSRDSSPWPCTEARTRRRRRRTRTSSLVTMLT